MKRKENPDPRLFMAATVLLMFLSVASMLLVGLAPKFATVAPAHSTAQAASHSVRANQSKQFGKGGQLGAMRGRITRWVNYFARLG